MKGMEFMIKMEIVMDQHYKDFSPMQFGSESCDPGHFFGPAVRTHWLLHYVVYGFGRFERGGISYPVKPGEIFVIPPYERTYYEADSKKPWRYIWIGFTTNEKVPEQLNKPVVHCPGAGKIFEDMLQCGKLENGRTAFLCAKLWELFSLLMETTAPAADYVQMACSCMHAEYANGITVRQVADQLNINRSYLSDLFRSQMGISPQQYLIQLRLEKAAQLLTVHHETPSTAGISVGYPDLYHFSRIFKQHFGVSPRNYQKLYQISEGVPRLKPSKG